MGKSKRKKSNFYKMKGCAKTKKTQKAYLGGSADVNLAYTSSKIHMPPNPNLAYTGGTDPNRAYPSRAPASGGFNFVVPQTAGANSAVVLDGSNHPKKCRCSSCKMGGSNHPKDCRCSSCKMNGSNHPKKCRCSSCKMNGSNHPKDCRCSSCKTTQMGGGCGSCSMPPPTPMLGGSHGLPYPNGLLGSAWTPDANTWPGVSGIAMDNNHLAYNNYAPVDVSRQMLNVGAQKPYTYLGGKRRHRKTRKSSRSRAGKRRGGGLSNFMGQDLVNLGRQAQFGVGSTYNALSGYQSPVNPLPWKDQMVNKPVSLMYTS